MTLSILAVVALTNALGPIAADWTIVTDHGVPGVEKSLDEAGEVLADVLGEAMGAKLAVVPAEKTPKGPGKRIFIGGSFAERAGLVPDDFGPYDYGMAERDGDLYLFGRDRGGSRPEFPYGCVKPSALAAVRFMEEEMGVLFLMPGKTGREVPKRAKLTVPRGFFRRGRQKTEYQAGRSFDLAYSLANGIYGWGVYHTYGGHTYPRACPYDKYFKTHPECFAKNADGTPCRMSPKYVAYCLSNPLFQKLLVEEMLFRYDRGAEVCQLAQNDGPQALCKCKACHDLYGTGDDWNEKFWLFHLDIAGRIAKLRPGKKVNILCYGDNPNPPKSVKEFPPNVMVEICHYTLGMDKWRGYTVPGGFAFYIYNWSWYPIPGFTPKRSIAGLVDQVKLFWQFNLKGIYRCGYGELFGMEGPAYWVYGKLLEDPNADVKGALGRYYRGAFGPAAEAMRKFYEDLEAPLAEMEKRNSTRMEDLIENARDRTKETDPIYVLSEIYTADRVRRMEAALAAAEGTPGLGEKQVRRLRLVRLEWNYAKNIGSIARAYREYGANPTPELLATLMEGLKERNRMIDWVFPDGKIRTLADWPEINLFGAPPLEQFRTNGRLGATLHVPLLWDVGTMERYGIEPQHRVEPAARAAEVAAAGLKPLGGFRLVEKAAPGAFFEPTADGTGFRFGCGTNHYVRVQTRLGAKRGLKPGRAYRVTWLTRWEHVLSPHFYRGYFVRIGNERGADSVSYPDEGSCLRGDSPGWMRQSFLFRAPDKPDYATDLVFAFWYGQSGVAEVRDVTIEDVTDCAR